MSGYAGPVTPAFLSNPADKTPCSCPGLLRYKGIKELFPTLAHQECQNSNSVPTRTRRPRRSGPEGGPRQSSLGFEAGTLSTDPRRGPRDGATRRRQALRGRPPAQPWGPGSAPPTLGPERRPERVVASLGPDPSPRPRDLSPRYGGGRGHTDAPTAYLSSLLFFCFFPMTCQRRSRPVVSLLGLSQSHRPLADFGFRSARSLRTATSRTRLSTDPRTGTGHIWCEPSVRKRIAPPPRRGDAGRGA